MEAKGPIQFITRSELDVQHWNACIEKASNGLVYAYTDYLDCMCDNWDGLVMGDYTYVMPLPWRKKWNIYYLYQPFLTAQLGLFGAVPDKQLLEAFLEAIPKKFSYWDLSLNHQNLFSIQNFSLFERSNFVLSLHPSYEVLYKNYRENIRRNVKKSIQYGCTVTTDVYLDAVIFLAKLQTKGITEKDFDAFKKLFNLLQQKGAAKIYGVVSKLGSLEASCVFFFSHNRAYYILVGNHSNGRTMGASHALIDAFIRDHAGQDLLLDFEGSDIRNLAFFYSSFGAVEEKYASIKYNRLPWWAKWIKK